MSQMHRESRPVLSLGDPRRSLRSSEHQIGPCSQYRYWLSKLSVAGFFMATRDSPNPTNGRQVVVALRRGCPVLMSREFAMGERVVVGQILRVLGALMTMAVILEGSMMMMMLRKEASVRVAKD